MMRSKVDEHSTSFIVLKKGCLKSGYIVRHRQYHERLANMLKDFMRSTVQLKEATIKENDKDSANTLLAVEYFLPSNTVRDAYVACIEERRSQ
jgi:hypothetical protein